TRTLRDVHRDGTRDYGARPGALQFLLLGGSNPTGSDANATSPSAASSCPALREEMTLYQAQGNYQPGGGSGVPTGQGKRGSYLYTAYGKTKQARGVVG